MITVLLEKIITILEGWIQSFTSHAQHVEDKLDSLDQTASDIETNTEPISDIADNTGAVVTPIQNIKSNTDSIKQSSQTSANNTTAILNNVSTLSTNTGRAAAFAEDCANNTLDIKDKVTTIASDTTQLRADAAELNDMSDKIYEAIKWTLVDKITTETEEGNNSVSFDTDLTNDLVSLEVGIESTQTGTGDPSPDNVRPITGSTNKSITINGNNVTIAFGQTVFGGTINLATGLLRITKDKVVFNGSENWFKSGTYSGGYYISAWAAAYSIPQTSDHIQNILKTVGTATEYGQTLYSCYFDRSFNIRVDNDLYPTVEDFKTWLSNKNVECVYPLKTPIEVQLTPSQIATIKGINTISTEGTIKCTYEESVKHYLDKQDN